MKLNNPGIERVNPDWVIQCVPATATMESAFGDDPGVE